MFQLFSGEKAVDFTEGLCCADFMSVGLVLFFPSLCTCLSFLTMFRLFQIRVLLDDWNDTLEV